VSASSKEQPARLKRRIAQLEAHLAAEVEARQKAWTAYVQCLHEKVDIELTLAAVEKALRGET
jgi:hypothetical protein